jgi:hypothetical protein
VHPTHCTGEYRRISELSCRPRSDTESHLGVQLGVPLAIATVAVGYSYSAPATGRCERSAVSATVMAPENDVQPAPLFDSLPYYDNDLETHPILREKVQHEVAVETQKVHQEALHPRVPPSIDLFVVSPSNE